MGPKHSLPSGQAYFLVAFGAFCISFAAPLVKWIELEPTTIAFYRTAIAGVALGILSLRFDLRDWVRKGDVTPWWRSLGWAVLGGIAFAGDLFVWHKSIRSIGAGLATLLANTHIFWVAVFSALWLGEKLTLKFSVWVCIALVGICLLTLSNGPVNGEYILGIQLGLLTGFFYAGYYLCLRQSQRGSNPLPIVPNLALASVVMAGTLYLLLLANGEPLVLPRYSDGLLLICLGVGVHAVGWLAISKGMPHVAAGPGAFILILQTVMAALWGVIWFDESLGSWQWSGGVITLVAVLGVTLSRIRENNGATKKM